jgi:hypothetical protein
MFRNLFAKSESSPASAAVLGDLERMPARHEVYKAIG